MLAEVLPIDKVGIYRRLRGEVPFTFDEAVTLCKAFDLSLDALLGNQPDNHSSFQLQLPQQADPLEADFSLIKNIIHILSALKESNGSMGGEATNILPQVLYLPYEYITRFYLFKWKYQFSSPSDTITYKNILVSAPMQELHQNCVELAKHLLTTDFLLDPSIFEDLLKDIKYFYNLKLLTRQETELVVADLQKIIRDMEQLCEKGCFPETGKQVNIYISYVNFDTSYCYIDSDTHKIILIKAFILYAISSTEKETCEKIKFWINSLKRQSNLISGTGQQHRIAYFNRQKRIIEEFNREIDR